MSLFTGGLYSSAHGKHWDISNHISIRHKRWEWKKLFTFKNDILKFLLVSPLESSVLPLAIVCGHFPVPAAGCLTCCLSPGVNMEMLGRRALWEVGLNYGHGTGHGVGNYFGVHECMVPISFPYVLPSKAGMSENWQSWHVQ